MAGKVDCNLDEQLWLAASVAISVSRARAIKTIKRPILQRSVFLLHGLLLELAEKKVKKNKKMESWRKLELDLKPSHYVTAFRIN